MEIEKIEKREYDKVVKTFLKNKSNAEPSIKILE